MKTNNKNSIITSSIILSLFMIFTISSLFLIILGANVYKTTINNIEEAFSSRTALTYITKKVRQTNTNNVYIGKYNNSDALIIKETIQKQDVITYIYYKDGYLYELFTLESSNNNDLGNKLLKLNNFILEEYNNTLIVKVLDNNNKELKTIINLNKEYIDER